MTNMADVYLGFQDEPVATNHERHVSWYSDRIGGSPNWMYANTERPPCGECHSHMLLVTQLFCQLDSAHYRTLYLFTCITKGCQGKSHSWRILRSQRRVESNLKATAKVESAEVNVASSANQNEWCDAADDWGDEEEEESVASVAVETDHNTFRSQNISKVQDSNLAKDLATNTGNEQETDSSLAKMYDRENGKFLSDCSDQLQRMNIHGDTEDNSLDNSDGGGPIKSQLTSAFGETSNKKEDLSAGEKEFESDCKITTLNSEKHFLPYFISTMSESLCAQQYGDNHVHQLMKEYERKEGSGYRDSFNDDSVGSGEKYERSEVKHGDRMLYKFKKSLARCPEQCIRYQWAGEPLLLSQPSGSSLSTSVPPCPVCGECRVFELQLMPALTYVLKVEDSDETPVEFGTVLVFSCRGSCWQDGVTSREEVALLMHYPDQDLFKM